MKARYYLGIDPAPAFGKKNDDGGLVVGKAWPKGEEVTKEVYDWHFGFVWARRVRGASLEEWSGIVHGKHQDFKFSKILLDNGAGGGGGFLAKQLSGYTQSINQIQTRVTPIVAVDETRVFDGAMILHLNVRRDPGIAAIWPRLTGDDNLVDAMHTAFRQAVESRRITFPKPYDEVSREEKEQWTKEMAYACKLLEVVRRQLVNVEVSVRSDGTWDLTRNGAKRFFARGKKDMAYAAIMAYVAFLIDLALGDFAPEPEPEDAFRVM